MGAFQKICFTSGKLIASFASKVFHILKEIPIPALKGYLEENYIEVKQPFEGII